MPFPLALMNRRRKGVASPYQAFNWAYDGSSPSNYTLTSGAVSEAANLGRAGLSANVATQATAADRPVIGTMANGSSAFQFSSATTEWMRADSLATKMNVANANRLVEIVFQPTSFAADMALCSWKASGFTHQNVSISCRITTGQIRIRRRATTGGGVDDKITDSLVNASAASVNVLSLLFNAGNVTGYLNGVLAFNAADWVGTVTGDLVCNAFAIGAFLDTTLAAPTTPFNGYIKSFAFREY